MKILFNRHTLQTLPFWLLSALGTLSGPAATITWNGGGGDTNWSTAGNWNGATPANGDTLVFSGSTRQTNTNNWLATLGAVTFTTGGFAIGGNAVTLNGDLTSTGNNTWNLATTLGSARIFTSQSGTLTLGGTITNAGYLTTIAGAGNTLISSAIGGTGGLAKTGAGTLTLSNSGNTYSGATSITGGILAISADSQLGTAPGTFTQGQLVLDSGTLSSTGTFSLDPNRGIQIGPFSGQGDGTINVGSGELTYNGIIASNGVSGTGNLVKSGAGTLTLGGANTYSGNTTISAGILKLASSTAIPSGVGNGNLTITSPGSLDINGNSLNLNGMTGTGTITSGIAGAATLTVGGNATTSTFGGVIQNGSGTLGLAKTGTGSFTLSGNNTFTGGLTINAGTVTLGSVGALNSTTPNSVTFGTSAPATTKLQIGGNNVTLASLATATIPGTAVVENASATAATLTVNQAIDTTFAGVLQNGTGGGTLGLTKGGAGTLTLSGTNTLTGLITINAGTVALSGGAAVPDTGAITFANTAGANLQLNASETVGSIAGGGSTGGNVLLQSFTLTTGGASTDTTYGGVISGTGNLIKTGTANMFLTRISTYSGNTTVKNGQLVLLNIDNALPQTTVLTLGDGTTNTSGVFRLNAQIQTLAGLTTAGTGTGNRVINGSATTKNFTLNIATTDTFAGILGGSTSDENNLNLIKSGSGTLTLTGTNTFSGTTSINAGIVSVGNLATNLGSGLSAIAFGGGALVYTGGTDSFTRGFTLTTGGGEIDIATAGQTVTLNTGNVVIAGTGNFTVGGAGNTTINSSITGASGGILNKTGIGTLTLAGANNYGGVTNLKNGTITLGANNAVNPGAAVTLGDATSNTNGVLKLNGYNQTVPNIVTAGTGTGNRLIGGNATLSTLTINNTSSNTYGGILGGTGTNENNLALAKSGTGTLTLTGTNTYTGGTTISGGTLAISTATNLGGVTGAITLGAATLQVTNSITSARAIALTDAASAISVTTGTTYANSGNITGTGALNLTAGGTMVVSGNNTYGGGTYVNNGVLMLGKNNALPTNAAVVLGNASSGATLALNGYNQTVTDLGRSGTGINKVVNGKSIIATITINNAADSTLASILGGSGTNENAFGLTKTGAGTLTLTAANTFTGPTTVSAGTLVLSGGAAIADTSTVSLANDPTAIIQLNANETTGSLAGGGTSGGNVNLQGFILTTGGNNTSTTYGGNLSGTGSLIKAGTGTMTLTGTNTYSGLTSITGGTLALTGGSAIADTGAITLSNTASAALQLNANETIGSLAGGGNTGGNINLQGYVMTTGADNTNTSYGGLLTGTGGLEKIGTGTFSLSRTIGYSGDTTITAGTIFLSNDNVLAYGAGKGNVIVNGTLDINGRTGTNAHLNGLSGSGTITNSSTAGIITVGDNNATSTFSGTMVDGANSLALTKLGTGTLTLSGTNTFTGLTTISAGTLALSGGSALADTNPVSIANTSGAWLLLNSGEIIGSLTGGGSNGGNVNLQNNTLTIGGDNTSPAAYSGAISGTGDLTKIGSGILTLSGNSAYSGTTWIQNGRISTNNLGSGGNLGNATSSIALGNATTTGALYYTGATATMARGLDVNTGGGEVEFTIGGRTLTITGPVGLTGNLLIEGLGVTALTGIVSGGGSLSKQGTGILTLSNTANTYSGGTTVTAGLVDVIATSGTPLGQNISGNNITVAAGGNLSLSDLSNKGGNQTITVTSSAAGLGGIGISNTSLTQTQLSSMFKDNTDSYGGVLGINNGISYSTPIDLSGFGTGTGKGYWFLGSGSLGSTYAASSLTVGTGNLYRLGGGGGSLTFSTASVLTGNSAVQVGFAGLNGDGTVYVTANQNYTGTTTILNGILRVRSDGATAGQPGGLGNVPATVTAADIVINGGTLSLSPVGSSMVLNANRGIVIGPASGSGNGSIEIASSKSGSYAGIIANNGSGTGNFIKTGSGTLILTGANTYSGTTTISAGTLNFSNLGNLGTGNAIIINGGTLQYATGNTVDITTRTVTTTAASGGAIDTNGNDVTFNASAITGTGGFGKAGNGTLTLNVANSYTGDTTITAGTLKIGATGAIPSGTGFGVTNVYGTLDLNNFNTSVNRLGGTGTITNSQTGAAVLTVDNGSSNSTSTFNGTISNGSGTIALNKIGTNTLALTGTNTYSGGTTVGVGTLSITSDGALGAVPNVATPGSITITGGAALSVTTDMTLSDKRGIAISGSAAAIISVPTGNTLTYNGIITNTSGSTGGLNKSNYLNYAGTLVLGGANTYAGDTTVAGGTLKLGNAAAIPSGPGNGNVSLSGTLDLNGYAITINGLTSTGTVTTTVAGSASITAGANNATSTFSGAIQDGSGTVNLGKTGGGTLTLSGVNTYTGTTTISQGVLSVGDIASGKNLGSATTAIVLGDATNTGILSYTGSNQTFTRGFSVNAGGGEIDSVTGTSLLTIQTGDINTAGTFTLGGAGNTTVASNITGIGGFTKTGAGTLILSGTNTYSGNTTLSGGTTKLTGTSAIPSGTGKGNLNLGASTTLDVNNLNITLNGLSGTGTITNNLTSAVTLTVGGNNATSSFGGLIQDGNGTTSFTKTGTGTLTFTAANTYSGYTTVDAGGTLEIGIATALPSGINKGNVIINGKLDLDTSVTVNGLTGSGTVSTDTAATIVLTAGANDQTGTFSGNLINGSGSGTVGLTKTGSGVLTLSGNNSYSGATTISTGTLAMGSATGLSPNSTLTIANQAFLDINGFSVAMDGLLGTGTVTNNGLTDAALTAGAAGGSTSYSGVIADGSKAIALTKSGAGTLTLTGINTYSGTTTVAGGTLSVANIGTGGNLGTGTAPIILGGTSTKGTLSYTGSADLTYARGFTVNAGGGEINTTASGKTLTLQTQGIVTAGIFTVSGAGNAVVQSVISGTGGLTKANTGSMILSSANTYSGDTAITTGTLQITNLSAIPSGTGKGNVTVNGTLDVNNLSLNLNGLSGSGLLTNTAGAPVSLTIGDNNGTGNFSGVIQDGAGTTTLTKIGTGVQTLAGANTYSGNTTISAGTLQLGGASAIPSGTGKGNVLVASNATLDLNNQNATINGLSGAGIITNSTGTAMFSVGTTNQTGTFSGTMQDGAGILGLTKTGTGMLTLSGTSTFSGPTTISQGSISMGSDTGLSSHSSVAINSAGALDLNGRVVAIDGLSGTGSITNNNATPVTLTIGASGGFGQFDGTLNDGAGVIALTKTGAGTITLTHSNSYSGLTTVTGGLLAVSSNAALGATPATVKPDLLLNGGGISATNTFEINANRGITVGPATGSGYGVLDAALNQTLTYNGIIANQGTSSGGLTKTGLGTLTLGGINTYSGDTTISTGALQIGNTLAVPSGTGKGNLVIAGSLDLNNHSIIVNGLSGAGVVSNTKTGSVTLTAGDADQSSTFAGTIANGNGTTALTKTGSGTLALTGINTFTGATTIQQGTLTVNGTLASPSMVVKTGTTLTGTGTVGNLTVQSNGTIAPGNSGIGTLNASGGLTLAGIANFELGTPGNHAVPGTGDQLAVTGNVTYGGTLNLIDNANAGGNGSIGAGSYKLISYTGTANGGFDSVTALPGVHSALHDVTADKALYIDVYNYATATVTQVADLGRIHTGGSFTNRNLTVSNTAPSGAFTESLGASSSNPTTGITASGTVSGIASSASNSSSLTVGISDNSAGAKSGSVTVNLTSQAVTGSGLGNTPLTPQNVSISGFAYTGQSTWTATSSGSWGNNTNDYSRWDATGGVPGLDGTLSAIDTVTFGNAITAPSVVSLNTASPSLKSVTFDSSNAYTLAQGTGGTLTLNGNGGTATVTVTTGSHTLAVPVTLASNVEFAITRQTDTLTVSEAIAGDYALTKTGAGNLVLGESNTYTGATNVTAGKLTLNGSLQNTAVTVADQATLTGTGTIGNATTKGASVLIQAGGTHSPGTGMQTINGEVTYQQGSIFEWQLNAAAAADTTSLNQGDYTQVNVTGNLAGSVAVFKVVLGSNGFYNGFWDTDKQWSNIFSSGTGYTLQSVFTSFAGNNITSDGHVSGQGYFQLSGNTLNWTAVPEPSGAVAGLLITAGFLRRRRNKIPIMVDVEDCLHYFE